VRLRAVLHVTNTATVAGLDTATLGDMLKVAGSDRFDRWQDQIRRTGGCSDPIHLTGWSITKDRATGETLRHYSTDTEPGGRLRIACGNRRASRCPACAWTYAGDTYHLIRAGLVGDTRHEIPATIRHRPRVFATLTAPSFGAVHNQPTHVACRCGTAHRDDDPKFGTPLDPSAYDYAGAVLFNNHAGDLCTASSTGYAVNSPAKSASHRRHSRKPPGSHTARSPNSRSAVPSTFMP
jgi:hypothetical protein